MNTLFDQMVQRQLACGAADAGSALCGAVQEVVLAGLYRGGFFKVAAFCGESCLRVFHGMKWRSDELEFSLLQKNPDFSFDPYFSAIADEAGLLGLGASVSRGERGRLWDVYYLEFRSDKESRIRINVATNPVPGFATEQKLMLMPFSFSVRCVSLPSLFAAKVHDLALPGRKSRVMGRDLYGFEWFVRNRVQPDSGYLQALAGGSVLAAGDALALLRERLASADVAASKQDVAPFVADGRELDIWSCGYFLQLADMVSVE